MKRRLRASICLLFVLTFVIAIILSGCTAGTKKIRLSKEAAYSPVPTEEKFRVTDNANLSLIASSSDLDLFFDTQNACISVKTKENGEYIQSASKQADKDGLSAVLFLTISDNNGKEYYLNSRDNSVVFGTFKTENGDNAASVTYSLAKEKEEASSDIQTIKKGTLRVDITLKFELDTDALIVSIGCDKTFISNGFILEKIQILPGFSSYEAKEGDFLILPDGSGVTADISGKAESDAGYVYYCYSPDIVQNENGAKAYLPFFAFKNAKSLICATIEDGDALAAIHYSRKKGESGAVLFPEFTVTLTERTQKHLFVGASYKGVIKIRYTFLGKGKSSYIDAATVCRERLVRNSVLKTGTLEEKNSIPFLLTAIGANSSRKKDSYTEFREAKEMLSIMKAKGVNNIVLRYMGTLSGGLSGEEMIKAKLMRNLGNKNELNALLDYARVQNLEVFFDINLLNTDKIRASKSLSGKANYTPADSVINNLFKPKDKNFYTAPLKTFEKSVSNALLVFSDKNISLGDISEKLYSDIGFGFTKQESKEYISKSLRAFGANGDIMLSEPALYLLKNAKYVSSMPMSAKAAFDENITAIPFLQSVLHGTVYYAGEPLNYSGDIDYAALKCIEYGCAPSAVLTYRRTGANSETYYVAQSPKLAKAYEKMNAQLSDLYGKRITGHTKVFDDVYCTQYANNSLVYVNYTNKSVEINGITLEGMDFMRVN